jgi:hypothetical protein
LTMKKFDTFCPLGRVTVGTNPALIRLFIRVALNAVLLATAPA